MHALWCRWLGSAAKRADDAKVAEFQQHGDAPGFEFVPLAMESLGRHGKPAMRFLSQESDLVSEGGGSKREFVCAPRACGTELLHVSCVPRARCLCRAWMLFLVGARIEGDNWEYRWNESVIKYL